MERMMSLNEMEQVIEKNQLVLSIIKMRNCGVCESVSAKVSTMLESKISVKGIYVYTEDVPEVASRYLAFSAPTVLLFYGGKEVYRAARFVRCDELDHVLSQYEENI
ncbi:thioredoxin family protein [Paenibacillus sp. Marseille-Q4541]|uniref:thioredoxin family protein n=1 Tax=Paenibacillus sp. Marseille-Q4541 TaxID=2831522 RepID=UPI001BA6AAE8|nr:thioredoxin family protein [Paenibacillus sp. Marseille-Q4541]